MFIITPLLYLHCFDGSKNQFKTIQIVLEAINEEENKIDETISKTIIYKTTDPNIKIPDSFTGAPIYFPLSESKSMVGIHIRHHGNDSQYVGTLITSPLKSWMKNIFMEQKIFLILEKIFGKQHLERLLNDRKRN